MWHRIEVHKQSLSRRGLLGGAIVFGAVLASGARAASKVPQSQAGYKASPNGAARCDRCVQFQPPAACQIVAGAVAPQGSCLFFAPRK